MAVSAGSVIRVGEKSPDFTLRNQNNQHVRLSEFVGRQAVLVVFYPLAFSGVCTGELRAVQEALPAVQNNDVQVLSISVDSVFSHKVWAEQEGFTFPLLADFWPHGEVARQYGVFDEGKGVAKRASFLVAKDGTVVWNVVRDFSEPRLTDDYLAAIAVLVRS